MSLLAKTTGLASSTCKSAHLAVLVGGVNDPVDAGIVADLLVAGIYKNNLVVFHCGILVDPVAVKHTHVTILASNLLLGNGLDVALKFELRHTLVLGLTVHHTLGHLPLASTTPNSTPHNGVSLLGLVTQPVSFVRPGGPVARDHLRKLTVLPSTDTEKEAKDIALLLAPELLDVFVGTHYSC